MPNESKSGSRLREFLPIIVPAIFLAMAVVLLRAQCEPVERLQNSVFDAYQRLKPRPYEDAPVRIVDIDDESLSRLGQWPWPRTLIATAVDRLTEMGAASIAFDIVFPEADRTSPAQILPLWSRTREGREVALRGQKLPDHDHVFAQAIAASHVVLGSFLSPLGNKAVPLVKTTFAFQGENPLPLLDRLEGAVINRPELEQAAAGNGSFTYIPENDGIIRRVPLVMRLNDHLIPSLAAEALRVAQGARTIAIRSLASGGIDKIKIGRLSVPTDAKGRLWVYFSDSAPERTIPIWKIFEKGFDARALSGSILFIGTSAAGLRDQRATPLQSITPGVEIHAQVAEGILLHRFLFRPDWSIRAETAYLSLLGVLLIVILQRRIPILGGALCCLSIAAACALSWWAFSRRHLLFDPLFPSLAVALVYVSSSLTSYLQSEGERRKIRNAFRYYLSPELVDQLARNPDKLKLGGEMRRMTYHFCDIEGFTSISEFYEPYALIRLLNTFLSPLTEIILKHHGTIDKYIGDCIVAFWNAPLDDSRHATNACLAVIEMHERLKILNEQRRREAEKAGRKFFPIHIRTGLNTGESIVGNMGSDQRFSYSVIGDDVNLASRLEGANKFFGTHIMASKATVDEAGGAVEVRSLGQVRVVGKAVPITVFELLSKKGELSEAWKKALPLYEKGLKEFFSREYSQAASSFEAVLSIIPKDGPSSLYLKMASDYAHLPPMEEWDGVFKLTEK